MYTAVPATAAPLVAPRFLSAPSPADPLDVTIAHLHRDPAAGASRQAVRGLTDRDIATCHLVSRRVAAGSGATHLHLQQRFAGIDVLLAGVDSTVDREGRLVAADDRVVRGLEDAIDTTAPRLSPLDATEAAAAALALEIREPLRMLAEPRGAARDVRMSRGGISLDDVPARLVYVPVSDAEVRLAWSVVIRTVDHHHWWQIVVDAGNGAVLRRYDWMAQDSYRVHPLPLSNPAEGARTLEIDPADALASPFGWHDTDGVAGAERTDTVGNNVRAQEDRDGDDLNGTTADGGPPLSFDFPFDENQAPEVSELASISQLFYLNNVLHDVFYGLGFDEAAGNFQQNDYGRGGFGADPVIADTLDGSGFNNANFGTPPDGESPRMQMFVFRTFDLTVVAPPAVAGNPSASGAIFGPLPPAAGLDAELAEALDPSDAAGTSIRDACSPLTNAPNVSGKIALVERGTCAFVDKVRHAQDAGAVGVVVYNDQGDGLVTMGGTDPLIVIPSIFIGQSDGVALRGALASSAVTVTLASRLRDSAFDNEIVIHEYAHGVTTRLTGGGIDVLCLYPTQSRGLGEGWSDFFAMAFTQKPGGTRTDPRAMAAYSLGDPLGPGLRRFPYSTDFAINPLTLAEIGLSSEVHDIGEIWATILWEMYWNLVDLHGFDPDRTQATAGNNIAVQLVMDALAIQPCSPTFTSARDAILQADLVRFGGANRCPIWKAFARRGVGVSADAGSPGGVAATSGFVPPSDCLDPATQDAQQQACIYTMNESLRNVMHAQGKSQLRCVSGYASNGLATSAEVCLIADPAGLLESARLRTEDREQRRCTTPPGFGKTDAATVNDAGFGAELGLLHDVFGPTLDAALVLRATDPDGSRCQLDVTKSLARCRNAQLQAFDRCKKFGLKSGAIRHPTDLAACLGSDPLQKIAKACDPVTGKLGSVCGDAGLDLAALFPGCAAGDRAALAQCLEQRVSCRACSAVFRADYLDPVIDCDVFDDGIANASCTPLP